MRPICLALSLSAVFGFVAGCSDPFANRNEVFGKVTFKGQPLDSGIITFSPLTQSADATIGSAQIKKGEYRIPKQNGLIAGKYRISVNSPDGKTPDNDPNAAPGPTGNFASKERIPKQYNSETKEEFDVQAGKSNEYNLSIP
jgi:hypothetical protein